MKSKVFIFMAFAILSCVQSKQETKQATTATTAENIVKRLEQRFNADSSTVVESDEMIKGQGVLHILTVEYIGCKKIDLMDRALKPELKILAQELKNKLPNAEKIKKYKIILIKDPRDTTPTVSGFNIAEKGFTFNQEDLN